jgi:hypothetical protein
MLIEYENSVSIENLRGIKIDTNRYRVLMSDTMLQHGCEQMRTLTLTSDHIDMSRGGVLSLQLIRKSINFIESSRECISVPILIGTPQIVPMHNIDHRTDL